MPSSKYLAAYLDAPMQSYGVESRFDRRTTLPYPSRSAVTGLVCAAMGVERNDRAFLLKMAALRMETIVLKEPFNLMDYHTVGGGYDDAPERRRFGLPRKADGKASGTMQTYRDYLIDAKFGVLISGDDALLERVDAALRDPVWGVWFGRKCCVPASPVAQGLFDDRESAVRRLCQLANVETPTRVVRDAYPDEEDAAVYMDEPVTFERARRGMGGEFNSRRIVVRKWNEEN